MKHQQLNTKDVDALNRAKMVIKTKPQGTVRLFANQLFGMLLVLIGLCFLTVAVVGFIWGS